MNQLSNIFQNDESQSAPDNEIHYVAQLTESDTDIVLPANYPTRKNLSHAQTIGKVVLDDRMDLSELVTVLCDTGALSANYVAKDLITLLKSKLKREDFFKTKCKVTLADNRTIKDIGEGVKLKLVLKDKKSHEYTYTGDFFVLDMKSNDIIIGLPALTGKLYPFMKALLKEAHEENSNSQPSHSDNYLNHLDLEGLPDDEIELENPWLSAETQVAQEDEETELPVNFAGALTFLGKSREEAIQDYYELLDTHVSEAMKEETDVLDYLKGDRALSVFVPSEWSGIKGIEPLQLKWKDTLPDRMKPKSRPINPKLWEVSQKEFYRLCGYFYSESRSPWASCLVVAPKATPPYIRFCGDYVQINKHMEVGNYTIPNVKHELDKIINYPIYLDIDLTNAFHQVPITDDTRQKLSIQTPWGQYAPNFMPEGIAPATGVLQQAVKTLFKDFEDWSIVIFDNLLILAHDMQDARRKLETIVDKCIEHNVKLKMAKSFIGFTEVKFFGYTCRHKSYEVSKDKKEALAMIPMPTNTTKARSLLGKGVFFAPFTPHYSKLVGHLTDMTKKTFNWNKETWKHDYEAEFHNLIAGLQKASEVFFPDYNLDWILRTDASEVGIGAVLLQVKSNEDNNTSVMQPIAFISKRFTEAAQRWATIEQEAYAIYYAVKQLAYYLTGKQFTVETDHNNLRWMEASIVPKIVRWRIYLQSFNFYLRHIAGKKNIMADWLSREHPPKEKQTLARIAAAQSDERQIKTLEDKSTPEEEDDNWDLNFKKPQTLPEDPDEQDVPAPPEDLPPQEHMSKLDCLEAAHNKRVGHVGERSTWKRIQTWFPGSGISYRDVSEHIAQCTTCIKTRLGMRDKLVPVRRTLKPEHLRSAIGIDAVDITPHSKDGYTHINVVVNLFTKFVTLYPVKGVTALNLANSVWKHWCSYGHTDMIVSDQGPDLTSKLMEQLVEYMGMRHRFSIADKHANGCERIIGEVVRHLRALAYDFSDQGERLDVFEDPSWIDSVQYILNSEVSSETGYTPFELTFGTYAKEYMDMAQGNLNTSAHTRLRVLNTTLKKIHKKSADYQVKLTERRAMTSVPPGKHNKYQPGDMVLFYKGPKVHPKMTHLYTGPYKVQRHVKNDVTCQHMATGEIRLFDVESLKIFAGSEEEAYAAARRDQDQHVIKRILTHRGDILKRSTLVFTTEFEDGEVRELPYSLDLFNAIPYEDYCRSKTYLRHLVYSHEEAKQFIKEKTIPKLRPGHDVYLNIMLYGNDWFYQLGLPDSDTVTYVSKCSLLKLGKSKSWASLKNTVNEERLRLNAFEFYCYAHLEYDPNNMVLIDEAFVVKYPQVVQK